MVQQIGRPRIADTTVTEIGLADSADQRLDTAEDAGDFQVMRRLGRHGSLRGGQIHPRQPGGFLEQIAVGETGGVVDQVDGPSALAGGMVEAPTGMVTAKMDDARAVLARRTPRQIGTAQRPAIRGQPTLGKQAGQPVRCRGGQATTNFGQVKTGTAQTGDRSAA
nr:hypothetical protein [Magnetospirillum gryphiswaldense]